MGRIVQIVLVGIGLALCVGLLVSFGFEGIDPEILTVEFATSEGAETDDVRTLQSVRREGDLFTIRYYGDNRARLEDLNEQIIEHGIQSVISSGASKVDCSIFAASGAPDQPIFGRNLDNYTRRGVLVGLFEPPDGYASIAVMNLQDMGFGPDDDLMQLSIEARTKLLNCVLFATDGMNERGVAVALASIDPELLVRNDANKLIAITYLQREVLDHASTLDEAIAIVESSDAFDQDVNTLSHHILLADPSGESAVAEYRSGGWQIIRATKPWQIATNNPLYGKSETWLRQQCGRYRVAADYLDRVDGIVTWQQGMGILQLMAVDETQWSSVYNLANRALYMSLHGSYDAIWSANLPELQ